MRSWDHSPVFLLGVDWAHLNNHRRVLQADKQTPVDDDFWVDVGRAPVIRSLSRNPPDDGDGLQEGNLARLVALLLEPTGRRRRARAARRGRLSRVDLRLAMDDLSL